MIKTLTSHVIKLTPILTKILTSHPYNCWLLKLRLSVTKQEDKIEFSGHTCWRSVSPSVRALLKAALVESSHGLIGGPCLDLHEERLVVSALGTGGFGEIDVLPGGRPSQNVVHFFQLGKSLVWDFLFDVLHVGAGWTRKPEAVGTLLHAQNVGAAGTELAWSLANFVLLNCFFCNHGWL